MCGNGIIEEGEDCDGEAMGDATCGTVGLYGGELACTSYCTFDDSACGTAGRCGDGEVQTGYGEQCDGNNLNDASCESLGFRRGNLSCTSACRFDTSGCILEGECGDSIVDPGEVCDGQCPDFGAFTTWTDCPESCQSCGYLVHFVSSGRDVGGKIAFDETASAYYLIDVADDLCHLTRLSENGVIVWDVEVADSTCYKGDVAAYDGMVVAAGGLVDSSGNIHGFVAGYGDNGALLWWNDIPLDTRSMGKSVIISGSYIYMSGYTDASEWGQHLGERDMIVAILDLDGNWVQKHQFGTSGDDTIISMDMDDQGNLYMVGSSTGNLCEQATDQDGVIFKTNLQELIWCHQFPSSGYEMFIDVSLDSQGNVYAIGETTGSMFASSQGLRDVVAVSISSAGLVRWSKQFGSKYEDYGRGIFTLDDEVYMAVSAGDLDSPQADVTTNTDAYILRIEPSTGDILWHWKYLEGDSLERAARIHARRLDDGMHQFITAGVTESNLVMAPGGDNDGYVYLLNTFTY